MISLWLPSMLIQNLCNQKFDFNQKLTVFPPDKILTTNQTSTNTLEESGCDVYHLSIENSMFSFFTFFHFWRGVFCSS